MVREVMAVAVDLEMFGQEEGRLHRPHGSFACLSICDGKDTTLIDSVSDLKFAVRDLSSKTVIMHNAMYDVTQLRRFISIPQFTLFDTMLVEQGLFGGYYEEFSLEALARRWLGRRMNKDVRNEFAVRDSMTPKMRVYALDESPTTHDIYLAQKKYIEENEISMRHYWEIDLPALAAVMDLQPAKVDVDGWLKLATVNSRKANSIADELGFNPGSPPQVMREVRGLKDTKAATLQQAMEDTEDEKKADLLRRILEYRTYKKAATTYGKDWVEKYVEQDGLVYPGWRVIGAETGRMSCRNPNLMQIPVRKMPEFRKLFVSKYKNGRIMAADVDAQEPRITAWFTRDEELLKALKSDVSIHLDVAWHLYHDHSIKKGDKRYRLAKDTNLGTVYGLSARGLAKRQRISLDEAETFLKKYFARFRGIKPWMALQQQKGYSLGYVTTASGRKVWLNPYDNQWERNAINGPIQGTAADHTKLALSMLHQMDSEFYVALVVHDEIVADLPAKMGKKYEKMMREAWLEAGKLLIKDVPIKVDVGVGPNWGAKEVQPSMEDEDDPAEV